MVGVSLSQIFLQMIHDVFYIPKECGGSSHVTIM